jgi:hypothetical protein
MTQVLKTLFENEIFIVAHDENAVYVTNKQTGIKELATKSLLTALEVAEHDCVSLLTQEYIIERASNRVDVR